MIRKIIVLCACIASNALFPLAFETIESIKPSLETITLGALPEFEKMLQSVAPLPENKTQEAGTFLAAIQKKFSSNPEHFKLLMRSPLGKEIAQLQDEKGATLLYYTLFHDGEKYVDALVRAGADRSLRVTQPSLGANNQTPLEFFKKAPMVFYSAAREGELKNWYTYLEKILDPTTDLSTIKEPFRTGSLLNTPADKVLEYLKSIDEKTLPTKYSIKNLWDSIRSEKASDIAWIEAVAQYKDGLLFTMKDAQNKNMLAYANSDKRDNIKSLTNFLNTLASTSSASTKKQLHPDALIATSRDQLAAYLDSVTLTAGTTFDFVQEAILNKKMDDPEWLAVLFAYKDGYFLKTSGMNGATLLHKAVMLDKSADVFKKLVNAGASTTSTNKSGKTALTLYSEKKRSSAQQDITELLTPKDSANGDAAQHLTELAIAFITLTNLIYEETLGLFD